MTFSRGLMAAAVVAAALGACGTGTGATGGAATSATADAAGARPQLRLYLLSSVAGALEPCGCSKDQLGGAAHLAAFVDKERGVAKSQLMLGAGPLFFQDPTVPEDKRAQIAWKADALADAAKKLGLTAWAPAANDWAEGSSRLAALQGRTGAAFLAANLRGDAGLGSSKIVDVDGIAVGVVGVSDPRVGQSAPTGIEFSPPLEPLRAEVKKLRESGARIVVGLASMQRGDALRMIDAFGELDVLVVGKGSDKGDLNDQPKPAVLIGDTLVVETSNHLQTIAVVDLFLREPAGSAGRIKLSDAGGVARAEELIGLRQQVRELEHRINGWEKDKGVRADDLAARRADLARLRAEIATLEGQKAGAVTGSFFKYGLVEVRAELGDEPAVAASILGYYKQVNAHNAAAFKDRRPAPAEAGAASYVGVDACTTCHAEERKVWDATPHAKAYPTLEKAFVEFNLDCVSCHVTGYERPGGSTVTFVADLKNVQCEVCHGPGSLHQKDPTKKGLVLTRPEPRSCVTECHHPPHVEGFDPVAKMQMVLGPGHGL